ncbi:MAG: tetratricopeptide repeat protein, partial [Planctomycetes bacterium]|nr:tetratricopeptide repeat protein [Planctomycetota bacterium]
VQPDTLLAELEAWVRWRCDPMAWIAANVPTPQARLAVAVEVRDRLAGWQRVVDGTRAVIEAHGVDATPFENLAAGEGPPEESWGLAASLRSLPDWTWAEDEVRAFAARLVRDDLLADAEGYLREAVRCSPSDAELHVAYGDVLLRAGEHDEARAQFERALQLDPGHPRAHAALATLGG